MAELEKSEIVKNLLNVLIDISGRKTDRGHAIYTLDSVMKKLDGIEPLDGYLRELVIIGHDCYAVSEKSVRFLGEERVEKQLERITSTSMPEGIFFVEEYTPRIIVEDGKVIAIEFWKESELVSEQLRTQMTRSLDELTRFFKMIESGEKEET